MTPPKGKKARDKTFFFQNGQGLSPFQKNEKCALPLCSIAGRAKFRDVQGCISKIHLCPSDLGPSNFDYFLFLSRFFKTLVTKYKYLVYHFNFRSL